jgi:predicted dithiol-disulfide oxidoreductase (DUF899 family)
MILRKGSRFRAACMLAIGRNGLAGSARAPIGIQKTRGDFGEFMADSQMLIPARELADNSRVRFPNESDEYRLARNALLAEEIELRRHMERVASQRRTLPAGGEISRNFAWLSETGPINFASLFGDKNTLMVYSMMYGPQRRSPCAMCTSFLTAWNGIAINLRERASIAVTARSPIERLNEFKAQRGLMHLPFFSDSSGEYTRTYVSPEDADVPGFSVFTNNKGAIRHFYSGEMSGEMSDPGQDPRGAPDLDPLWLMLDWTPEGRGVDWYPKLDYGDK